MSANSKIEWCDHTYNPWIGCTKVSPGCVNCYAAVSTRARVLRAAGQETWGKGKARSRTKTGGDPLKWNRMAERDRVMQLHSVPAGQPHHFVRPRVFCASMADWLDDEVPIEWLADLLELIQQTPNLDWLLLTKRPQNFWSRIQAAFMYLAKLDNMEKVSTVNWLSAWMGTEHCEEPGEPPEAPSNVWIGTTFEVENDERLTDFLEIPAVIHFLSCEPLLKRVHLEGSLGRARRAGLERLGVPSHRSGDLERTFAPLDGIDWVICGGESGSNARPMHPDWARCLRDECVSAGVPFLFKQWGEWLPVLDCEKDDPDGRADYAKLKRDGGQILNLAGGQGFHGERVHMMQKVGKKAAGRLLDGREWNEFPGERRGA